MAKTQVLGKGIRALITEYGDGVAAGVRGCPARCRGSWPESEPGLDSDSSSEEDE